MRRLDAALSNAPEKISVQSGSRQSHAAKETSREVRKVREVFLTTKNMIPPKSTVSLFVCLISLFACLCYGQDDMVNSRLTNAPTKFFSSRVVNRFEEMFKTGDIDLKYYNNITVKSNIFHYAALTGSLDRVKILLKKGADVNLADECDITPLHYAALSGNLELVQYLVEQGADVNSTDNEKKTVLTYAAQSGNLELVKWLVELGLDLNAKDYDNNTVLHYAAQSGNLELVQWLVEQGLDINAKGDDNNTVLHYAAQSGNVELVQWLVEQELDLNAKDDDNNTVLHYAAQSGNLELVQWLVKQGLDINAKGDDNNTVLNYAALSGNLELVKWLVEQGLDIQSAPLILNDAIRSRSIKMVQWLIDQGLDINSDLQYGQKPLHNAVLRDIPELVQWLVKNGADVNAKDNAGTTPISCVAVCPFLNDKESIELIQWFIEHGSNLKADGADVLTHSSLMQKKELVLWLINQGIDVNATNTRGETPLETVCDIIYDLEMVQFLVEHGANANPNFGKKALPYWFELWKYTSGVKNPFDDPLIRYLMFHDKMFVVGLPGLILAIIVGIWIAFRLNYSKQKRNTKKSN